MNQKQARVISFLSLVLGMFGLICGICISQGIKLPFEKTPVRIGSTVIVPIVPTPEPVNIETEQELASAPKPIHIPEITIVAKAPDKPIRSVPRKSFVASNELPNVVHVPHVVHVPQSEKLSFESIRPGAARRRPEAVSKERAESARGDGSSLKVPGGAVWATDEALTYDPMNGEL